MRKLWILSGWLKPDVFFLRGKVRGVGSWEWQAGGRIFRKPAGVNLDSTAWGGTAHVRVPAPVTSSPNLKLDRGQKWDLKAVSDLLCVGQTDLWDGTQTCVLRWSGPQTHLWFARGHRPPTTSHTVFVVVVVCLFSLPLVLGGLRSTRVSGKKKEGGVL